MSKAKRSLLFSLFTLIMAVAITATSTYAWFVVNKEVTASGMQVEIKSDTTYLVISSASTTVTGGTALDSTSTTLSVTASDAKVLPVRYNEGATPASGNTKWETASGTDYDNGSALNNAYTPVTTDNASKYYVLYTFYVGLTNTTAQAASHLRVKEMSVTNVSGQATMQGAVSAVISCEHGATPTVDGTVDYESIGAVDNAAPGTYYSSKGDLAATVALNTVYTVNVYVYMNGDHASIKSSNGANLGGFQLSVTFEVTAA